MGKEGDTTLGELVSGDEPPPEEELTISLRREAVQKAVAKLPEREREVVKMRFGLNGDPDPQSLEQIGKRLGLTRERVRQIETQALERLAVERELDALTPPSRKPVDAQRGCATATEASVIAPAIATTVRRYARTAARRALGTKRSGIAAATSSPIAIPSRTKRSGGTPLTVSAARVKLTPSTPTGFLVVRTRIGSDPSPPRLTWSLPSLPAPGPAPPPSVLEDDVSPSELPHVFDACAAASSSGSGIRLKITSFVSVSALRAGRVRARMT